ncbi:uncharacterized protein Z518_00735 [Rhinocladiella mackenziei CBS 650.93]|uniref:Rhinocladiella mackenziei CBS 650.93 unplaced genomic scaffold supercont1.1, whole genome shotgun sequence n=1 Tax=Rhinocladiella mackenziei CBS 650.93 TaxID=1442369 RepID=A0A0D2IUB9_9EURO|nr:uncharacterized protein Z518_00735 [Rhinocladiella mackenziei CBS 650.93]KIX09654.1 hypothetical protein Z518_00735 [Rhinocladiella mackenziei CBS 650.93]
MAAIISTIVVRDGARSQLVQPEVASLIADFEIYQSRSSNSTERDNGSVIVGDVEREAQPADFDPTLAPRPTVAYPVSNPAWWETTFRRVPDYRPINYELDLSERRQNLAFTIVGSTMLLGRFTLAVS